MNKLACFCGTGANATVAGDAVGASRRGFLSGLGALGAAALLPGCQTGAAAVALAKPHRIDIHHHIMPPKYVADLARLGGGGAPKWSPQMSLEDMDANGIATSVVALMQPGAMLLLMSRAAAADFSALTEAAGSGRIRVATDVFPLEPLPKGDPIRAVPNMLFSPHRAGALTFALREIGARVLEDLDLIARGLPPVACRRAERETVARMRSKPVEKAAEAQV